MTLHSKQKGNIGEMAVAKELMSYGWAVFTELGDLSKVDLIATKNEHIKRIQVKYVSESNGRVHASRRKRGPNYKFLYQETDFDLFAIYCPQVDAIAYLTSAEICSVKTGLNLRLDKPLNNQTTGIKYFKTYSLEKALRGHTCDTQTDNAVGNEMVQTTIVFPSKRTKRTSQYLHPTKINWPNREELQKLVSLHSMVKVGAILGVSDNAVRKRCIRENICWKQASQN
jgi:hypothetical protein